MVDIEFQNVEKLYFNIESVNKYMNYAMMTGSTLFYNNGSTENGNRFRRDFESFNVKIMLVMKNPCATQKIYRKLQVPPYACRSPFKLEYSYLANNWNNK
jgi:hypothetical protein